MFITWEDIDLGFMYQKNVAVLCRTYEGLRELMKAIEERHPKYRSTTSFICSKWNPIEHGRFGFAVKAYFYIDSDYVYFEFGRGCDYLAQGYSIIELCDITGKRDFGVFDTGFENMDAALAALF